MIGDPFREPLTKRNLPSGSNSVDLRKNLIEEEINIAIPLDLEEPGAKNCLIIQGDLRALE